MESVSDDVLAWAEFRGERYGLAEGAPVAGSAVRPETARHLVGTVEDLSGWKICGLFRRDRW